MKPAVEVEMVNESSGDLENAEARFGKYVCKWGWVVKGASKSYMYYPHPITAQTELHWDASGSHRTKKIDLSKVYPPGKSGRLTFTVYDDRVAASFRGKSSE
jgi:hypothetical protein